MSSALLGLKLCHLVLMGQSEHKSSHNGIADLLMALSPYRLYCAHDAEIFIFELNKPGTNTHKSLILSPTKKSVSKGYETAGQRGQISCLCVVQDHFAGTSQELLAVGTFAGSIGIYQMSEGDQSAEQRCLMGWSEGSAGVTQVSGGEDEAKRARSDSSLLGLFPL
jgi:hypothetical protein